MKLTSIASFIAFAASVVATPNPLPGSDNVIVRDPAIWYNSVSKKYFVFATGGGIKIFTSNSLTGPWTSAGQVLPNCANVNSTGRCELWAPDINYYHGEYVLYYSASETASQNSVIGVATSPSMENGTWTDHGEVLSSTSGDVFNAIDPNLIYDDGLKLSFGSYWNGMYQIGLWPNVDTKAFVALPGTHLAGANGRPAEGGFVYKPTSQPYTYFFFSDGKTILKGETTLPASGDEYKVRVGRGYTAKGPFYGGAGKALTEDLDPPTGSIVLASHDNIYAPGGQSVYLDPVSGRDIIVYHYVPRDAIGGYSYLGINYLNFSTGWPVVVDA